MEIMDMFDQEKFAIIEKHLSRSFFFGVCKRLDSWPHYYKWIIMSEDEVSHPNDYETNKGCPSKKAGKKGGEHEHKQKKGS